jgi:pyridoxamine 5'-phosphate oxidase
MDLSQIRNNYLKQTLDENSIVDHPIHQLEIWLEAAKEADCHEFSAMTVATTNLEGQPSLRVVLLKYLNEDGLYFFTNYESKKGKDLAKNPKIAAHLFWPELERQINIEGFVTKVANEMSDLYFQSRPIDSQLSAIVSQQSSVIPNRATLEELWKKEEKKWKGKTIERPQHWGGFLITINKIEFWQGRSNRLHDRILYKKSEGSWKISRLAP